MNKLWRLGHNLSTVRGGLSRIIELANHLICGCAVSVKADIGEGTIFFHRGLGCVVHPNAIIGSNCIIFPNVTLGSKWSNGKCQNEAPKVGNNVMVGAGAVILGDICIGDNCIIAANAVVTKNIPENCVAAGVPAVIRKRSEDIHKVET